MKYQAKCRQYFRIPVLPIKGFTIPIKYQNRPKIGMGGDGGICVCMRVYNLKLIGQML
jgi:hypothetical protein